MVAGLQGPVTGGLEQFDILIRKEEAIGDHARCLGPFTAQLVAGDGQRAGRTVGHGQGRFDAVLKVGSGDNGPDGRVFPFGIQHHDGKAVIFQDHACGVNTLVKQQVAGLVVMPFLEHNLLGRPGADGRAQRQNGTENTYELRHQIGPCCSVGSV